MIKNLERENDDFEILIGRDYFNDFEGNNINKYSQFLNLSEILNLIVFLNDKYFMLIMLYEIVIWILIFIS